MIHDAKLGKYRMYYRGRPTISRQDGAKDAREVTCYAESLDGIEWVKPNLGLYDIAGTRENNVILSDVGPETHNFCPFLDTRPGVSPKQRYKAAGGVSTTGLLAYVSEDGIHWSKLRDEPIINKGALDSQNVIFWSQSEECYICYFRTWRNDVRWISRTTSKDFLHWTEPVDMSFGDAPNEHLYINQTHPYFRAPHIYIGTAARFMPGRRALTDAQVAEIDLENPRNYAKLREGCSDGVLLTSRGGNRYTRTFLEAFIRPTLEFRNWVARANYPALGIVSTGENEISLYVQRHYGQPSAHLERMALRTDGFISVHGPYAGGEMLTKPLRFVGRELVINYATAAAGSVFVEIQDGSGAPISGFTREDADELIGDQIDRVVTWKADGDVSRLAGKPIRLRFSMKDADLYSIQFRQ